MHMHTVQTIIITRDRKKLEHRRSAAGRLFAKGVTQYAIAKRFGVSTAATNQWYKAWKKNKKTGLNSKGHPGFPSVLSTESKRQLKALIIRGPKHCGYTTDFWTIDRIRAAAKKKLTIDLGYTRIWNTVISLGFSVQKPERRAKERNEKGIVDWKLTGFPKLKKMGG
jgi:transposase